VQAQNAAKNPTGSVQCTTAGVPGAYAVRPQAGQDPGGELEQGREVELGLAAVRADLDHAGAAEVAGGAQQRARQVTRVPGGNHQGRPGGDRRPVHTAPHHSGPTTTTR
jgi:hypothetical protein